MSLARRFARRRKRDCWCLIGPCLSPGSKDPNPFGERWKTAGQQEVLMKGHSLSRAVLACIIVLLSVYTFAILNSYPSSLPNRLTVERFSQDWVKEIPRHPLVRHVLHSKIANRTRAWIRDTFPYYDSHVDSAKRFFRGRAVDDSEVQEKRNYSSIFSKSTLQIFHAWAWL